MSALRDLGTLVRRGCHPPGGRPQGAVSMCQRHGRAGDAESGQTLVLGAAILALVVLPLALLVFEEQMAHTTYDALQQAVSSAALDAVSAFDAASLGEGQPQLDRAAVQQVVEASLQVSLQQTAPEVSPSAAQAAAHTAAVQGTQIAGLSVCVTVAVPIHLLTNASWGWTDSARSCARAVVPSPSGGP
jgi:hypothetical protein